MKIPGCRAVIERPLLWKQLRNLLLFLLLMQLRNPKMLPRTQLQLHYGLECLLVILLYQSMWMSRYHTKQQIYILFATTKSLSYRI